MSRSFGKLNRRNHGLSQLRVVIQNDYTLAKYLPPLIIAVLVVLVGSVIHYDVIDLPLTTGCGQKVVERKVALDAGFGAKDPLQIIFVELRRRALVTHGEDVTRLAALLKAVGLAVVSCS